MGRVVQRLGDIGQVAVPVYAAAVALYKKDYDGIKRLALAAVINQIAIELLKYSIGSKRPNGGHKSFPSGHTAAAFLGPGFLAFRYGISTSTISSAVLAAGVGLSRILANKHWRIDVVGGALLGLSVTWLVILT